MMVNMIKTYLIPLSTPSQQSLYTRVATLIENLLGGKDGVAFKMLCLTDEALLNHHLHYIITTFSALSKKKSN